MFHKDSVNTCFYIGFNENADYARRLSYFTSLVTTHIIDNVHLNMPLPFIETSSDIETAAVCMPNRQRQGNQCTQHSSHLLRSRCTGGGCQECCSEACREALVSEGPGA